METYEKIARLLSEETDVATGKMMSSPGLKYKNKVFAFFYEGKGMCFKLGRDFDLNASGIYNFSVLSPFQNKAPLYDWMVVEEVHEADWPVLARIALERMQAQLA